MGRVVLITGATGALGRVVAEAMAETGARLVLTSRREDALQQVARSLALPEDRLLLQPADLGNAADVTALVAAIEARWGGADILLNCAGGWSGGERLAEVTDEDWEFALTMNLHSAFRISRAVLPYMVEQGWGRIVNVASRAAVSPRARQASHNVAKAGVVALTQSVAADYGRRGVAANVILPSIIDTPGNRESMSDANADRWVEPREIAEMMRFLCTEAGAALNGASIEMYGRV